MPRRYTRKDKVAAVTAAAASSVLAAAEKKGIPESTLRYWLKDPSLADLRDKTRAEMAEGWEVLGHLAQGELRERIPTMESRDLIVLSGMATERSQLLRGEATSRHESRDITADLDDHERAALKDAITAELAKREVEA